MRLGFHASIRNGFVAALEEAAALDCSVVQIFPRRPGYPYAELTETRRMQFAGARRELGVTQVLAHSVFQPNLASTNSKIYERSKESLLEELDYSGRLGLDALVVHAGSYSPDSNAAEGLKKSARTLRWALEQVPSPIAVYIENVGGGHRRLGGKLEELRILLDEIALPGKTGVCLDTAHAFAAGFPLQTPAGMTDWLEQFDRAVGLAHLKAFHINDSGGELGSHKDIHMHLGEGLIGLEALRALARDPRLDRVPGILETPARPEGSNKKNLDLLRND